MNLGDLFKELVWDALVKAALRELFAAAPYLAWGPLGYVVSFIVTHFSEQLYSAVKLSINLEQISYANEEHRKAFDRASATLKIIAHDKGLESQEFKDAKDAAKVALSQFVRFSH